MKEFKRIWNDKYTQQGRINITVFFVNIFLLLCHIFLMIIYCVLGHKFMIGVNILSLLLYIFFIFNCYKNIERYMGIAFLEIWLHMICGILSFGWTPCYQNWCFGMIAAYFLPSFIPSSKGKMQLIYTFLIVFSYFFLSTTFPFMHLSITQDLDIVFNSILFIANNSFVFFTIIMFAIFYTNKSNRKEMELTRKADFDELTNLYNRYALSKIGDKLIESSENENDTYNVAILDIDFFKKVNDTYGHTSGDMVLKQLALLLRQCSSKGIIAGRWGGEEFVLLAPHNISYKTFVNFLEKLREKVSKTKFEIEKRKKINLTISIGSKSVSINTKLEDAVGQADINLYKAKEKGRNLLISK